MAIFLTKNTNIECERKFLIKYPDIEELKKQPGCVVTEMEQTYLLCQNGSMRVRKAVREGKTEYIRNIKRRISDVSRYEDEKIISGETYSELLLCKDTDRNTVVKTRLAFPYKGHIAEIDVYPFWNDRAVLEIELESESEEFEIPPMIYVIKEITDDGRYSNKALAKEIVTEQI